MTSTDGSQQGWGGPPPGWYPDYAAPGQLRYFDGTQWMAHTAPMTSPPPGQGGYQPVMAKPNDPATTVRRLAEYEKVSGILWIVLGVIQILLVLTIIAGVWNIFAGITRLKFSKRIAAREQIVPAAFQGVAGLVIIGVINLLCGGVIGLVFVGLDFFVRDQVLKHSALFNVTPHAALSPTAVPAAWPPPVA